MAHASVAGWRPSICRSRQLTPRGHGDGQRRLQRCRGAHQLLRCRRRHPDRYVRRRRVAHRGHDYDADRGGAIDAKLCLERTTSVPELLMDFEQRLSLRTERDPDRAGQSLDRNRPITCRRRSLESAGAVISSSGSLNAWTSYDAESDPETTRGLTSHSYTPIGFAQGLHRPDGVLGRCRVRNSCP